jgi:ribosome-binding protein aMBF1 (putative translation factor)
VSGTAHHNGTTVHPDGSPEAIQKEIERTREELALTVDELHRRLDMKAQVRNRLERARSAVTSDSGKPSPAALGLAALAVAGVGLLLWRRLRG